MKIKEAEWARDEKLFERSEFFSSVVVGSVVFSQDFIVSLDFFGLACAELDSASFIQGKNEQIDNHCIKEITINRT